MVVPVSPAPSDINSTSVVLKWNPPLDPNGDITDYTVNLAILSTDVKRYRSLKAGNRRRRQTGGSNSVTESCVTGRSANLNRNITTGNAMTALPVNDLSELYIK